MGSKKNKNRRSEQPAQPASQTPAVEVVPAALSEPVPPPKPLQLEEQGPFFNRYDWAAFIVSFLVALVVYTLTLSPTVSLEDSGELATAGEYLGVPHPPGYPSWTMFVWIFAKIFGFVQFRGQPNPAWGIAFASAFFGALSAAITAMLVCRSGRDFLRSIKRTNEVLGVSSENAICWAGGVASSLLFAFSPCEWSQSVIVEVYSLNAFFLALLLLLAYMWIRRPSDKLMMLTGLVFGLGLTNYQALLLMLLTLLLIIVVKDIALTRDFMISAGVFGAGVFALVLLAVALKSMFPELHVERIFPHIMDPQKGTVILAGWSLKTIPPSFAQLSFNGFCVISAWLLIVLAAAFRFLPRGRTVALTGLCVLIGLAIYGFMPVSSEFNPPMNWGYPRTWEGFKHALSRGQYERIAPSDIFTLKFIHQMGGYMSDLRMQFTMPVAILGFLPFAVWVMRFGQRRIRAIFPAVIITAVAAVLLAVEEITPDSATRFPLLDDSYYLLTGVILMLLVVGATVMVLNEGHDFMRKIIRPAPGRMGIAMSLLAAIALLAAIYIACSGVVYWQPPPPNPPVLPDPGGVAALMVLKVAFVLIVLAALAMLFLERTSTPISERITVSLVLIAAAVALGFYAGSIFQHILLPKYRPEPGAAAAALISMTNLKLLFVIFLPILIGAAMLWLMREQVTALDTEIDPDSQKWIIATVSGFAVMSVLFVALADPKGDIQDAFIQRVKFISSHALYAVWIGYGAIFGLACVTAFFRGNWLVKWGGVVFVCILPALPIAENYYNAELVRVVGGAEQNDHDYGWQFGNYQLRGADAITEELAEDEEPLPNPSYPPEMGPRAVFFGGTDPGRFVPTYMIFSARVRSDVYLITQNALADNTYMSVMRDLYGNEIWIPSTRDGNDAFSRYIDDVRAGRVPPSADIKIENGRVSVQGVGGVMLINGILAQMIFEHNRDTHDFYVEESYVIMWMYPYLSPHGLIMKINHDQLPSLSESMVRNDLDFWDWYTRRLLGSTRFTRDVVARKSFSKLRSAIAGLYAFRGQFPQAEQAFRESIMLYPLSPEANFRLADLYMRWNRMQDAALIMEQFAKDDPGNTRAVDFLRDINNKVALLARRRELEEQLAKGPSELRTIIELADVYRKLGLTDAFAAVLRSVIENPQIPAQALRQMAQMAFEERRWDVMAQALDKYVGRVPTDSKAWIELALVRMLMQNQTETIKALQQAVRVGGDEAIQAIRDDRRFDPIRSNVAFQRLFNRPNAGRF